MESGKLQSSGAWGQLEHYVKSYKKYRPSFVILYGALSLHSTPPAPQQKTDAVGQTRLHPSDVHLPAVARERT